jgi:HEAT repeat protein
VLNAWDVPAEDIVAAVEALLKSSTKASRIRATSIVKGIPSLEDTRVVSILARHLEVEPDPEVRHRIVGALGSFRRSKAARGTVIETLIREPNALVIAAGVQTLSSFEISREETATVLLGYLNDRRGPVRVAAVRALGCMQGVEAARQALVTLDLREDHALGVHRDVAVARLAGALDDAIEVSVAALEGEEPEVRQAGVECVFRLAASFPELLPLIREHASRRRSERVLLVVDELERDLGDPR